MKFYWKFTRHFLRKLSTSVSENADAVASNNSFNINNTDNNINKNNNNLLNSNEMSFLNMNYKKTHINRNDYESNYDIR